MNHTEKSISELQREMDSGLLSSKDLVIAYLKRIQQYDRNGPGINSIAELNPDAIAIAEALDRERALHHLRGPLHGIPILIKDNISTGDKMRTTAGSIALEDNFAKQDASFVKQLRKSGAIILGKTNLSEFSRYMALKFPDGYSSRGGQVRNPYHPDFPVSGSSSGSAAAVAGEFCSAAIGTETAGSITYPAGFNGICGLKPTVGLVSRFGIIPICGQDTAGPMGRTVSDCAILLNGMITKDDPYDPATHCISHLTHDDYTQFLKKDCIRDMRIGVNRILCDADSFPDDVSGIFEEELLLLKENGAALIDCPISFTGLENGILGQATMLYEFKSAINSYLSRCSSGRCRSLSDIIAYNQEHKTEALRYGQDLLLLAEEQTSGRLLEAGYWTKKLEAVEEGRRAIDTCMKKFKLDVIASPCYSNLPAITGYPSITVPMGFSKNGIPVGMTFYAGAFQEGSILAAAFGYEQLSKRRIPPALDRKKHSHKGGILNE